MSLECVSGQWSVVSYQLSAISYQLSAISYQLSAISHWPKANGCSRSVRVAHMLTY
ncbi:MAG: hypothetical protein F6K50_45800 [Moorea sp. SIO3I7]|nr:hypothetical protein [Moorena sp. SIO3I7]NEO61972.1 hypothetical protein [Moorena sp. SIO4G2]